MHKGLTVAFWRDQYYGLVKEVDQVLGKALGYPEYYKDQKNFPGAVEGDGVCTGSAVPEDLIAEAANRLKNGTKSLAIKESDNTYCTTYCTAELEVKLERLASYFERKARENKRRASNLEQKLKTFHDLGQYLDNDRSSYYFSGKEDTYRRAANKLRELFVSKTTQPSEEKSEERPEEWVVEVGSVGFEGWARSQNPITSAVFPSKQTAELAIAVKQSKFHARELRYRAVRVA